MVATHFVLLWFSSSLVTQPEKKCLTRCIWKLLWEGRLPMEEQACNGSSLATVTVSPIPNQTIWVPITFLQDKGHGQNRLQRFVLVTIALMHTLQQKIACHLPKMMLIQFKVILPKNQLSYCSYSFYTKKNVLYLHTCPSIYAN